jgi:plasmid stabilization system protein ParE
MRIRILPSAVEDLARGWQFYEQQGQGLGNYFLDTLFSDIESLALYAGIHRKIDKYYRLLSKRFPFGIYYQVHAELIEIWRVLDLRQDPAHIKKALK